VVGRQNADIANTLHLRDVAMNYVTTRKTRGNNVHTHTENILQHRTEYNTSIYINGVEVW